jgi:DNA polymerase-3 subunit chi
MTRITFYFNADSKAEVAMRLAGKAWSAGRQVLVYAPDPQLADELDHRFWTANPLAFLPHVRCGHPLARQTPVLIGDNPEELERADILINLGAEPPPFFARFERVLEVVGRDASDRESARGRFRYFRERGYALDHHDLAEPG